LRTIVIAVVVVSAALVVLYGVGTARIARVETVADTTVTPAPGAKFIQTRSGRVHVLDVGTGPPLLLMHGSGRSIVDWQQGAAEALAARHRVVAFDYYGLGFSEHNAAFTYGYDLWVQEAVDLLDALQIDHVTVVGHSVGGALACILAADHPERVDHVVTIGTGMTIEPAQFLPAIPGVGENMLASMTLFGDVSSPEQRAELEAAYRIKGTRAALLTYIRRQMTVDGVRLVFGVFEDIKVPVLHVSGSRDRNIPPEIARRLTDRTHGSFVSIDGAGHSVQVDAPQQLAQAIEDFVARPPTSTSTRP
jgi:pimeloyl-ACP methyl ester carboxylesterase